MIHVKNSHAIIGKINNKIKVGKIMKVLVFAPHNDDEILGVGGTIKKYINEGHEVYICEVTAGLMYKMLQDEAKKAHNYLGIRKTFFLNLPVGELKMLKTKEINTKIDEVVKEVRPDIAYVPFLGDMHLDHREVTEAAMVALRPIKGNFIREIYMYETLSETGWHVPLNDKCFNPNVWVNITGTIENKLKAMEYYQSQLNEFPHPRSQEGIRALAKFRGSTIGVHYAESFMLVRKVER